jgi:FHS family L-fucose permease-like MFS transporter
LAKLNTATEAERAAMLVSDSELFTQIQKSDLGVVSGPYWILGLVVLVFFVVFLVAKLPDAASTEKGPMHLVATTKRLLKNPRYCRAVIAQAFYVGVQIMVWTFIIQYAELEKIIDPNTGLPMTKATAQGYNMVAMGIFVSSRFICTYLLKYVKPSFLLTCLAIGGMAFTLGTIFLHGMAGLYCLVAISACMSLMFPTIYGMGLKDLGDDAKLGSAGLILAIGGGMVMPPLQGWLIDKAVWLKPLLSEVRFSFVLPLLCFVVIAQFGYWYGKNAKAVTAAGAE